MYAPLIAEAIKNKGYRGILIPMSGCLPTVKLNRGVNCIDVANNAINSILDDKSIKHGFLSMTWYQENYTNIFGELLGALIA